MASKLGKKLLIVLGIIGALLGYGAIIAYLWHGIEEGLAYALLAICAMLAMVLVLRSVSARTKTRLLQVQRACERFESSQRDTLAITAQDEFTSLSRSFNHMTEIIAAHEEAVRDQNQTLMALNRRMETVLNATNDGVALLDRTGRLLLVNRRFCEMLGARAEDLWHRSVAEVKPLVFERLSKPERLMRCLSPATEANDLDPSSVLEDLVELTTTERRFLKVYAAPVRDEDGDLAGRLIALHDITREMEIDKMKTEFISVVSHELRTPLTSIKGYTDLLLTGQTGEVNDLQKEFLGIVQNSATRLGNLINDILDISRIESGRMELKMEPVDYGRIVTDVLRLMKPAADEKDISIDASFPENIPLVRGDADKITQILTNLLSNGIKYTPAGGWVKVYLDVTPGECVTTCVQDSGIGISPADQKRLFQKFFRADNSLTREAGGTGLGLAIVKTMIELLGGTIWLESAQGKGSKFFYTLQLATGVETASEGHAEGEPVAPAKAQSSVLVDRGLGLVLVAEHDGSIRDQLQHTLHRLGYGVVPVPDLAEALQRARQHRPNVILLDMMMPEQAGFRALRALRADPSTAGLPIVAFSLAGDPAQGKLALGTFCFQQKPVNAKNLAISIKQNLPDIAPGKKPHVLLVACASAHRAEKEQEEVLQLASALSRAGVSVQVAATPSEAVSRAVTEHPDVVVIDEEKGESAQIFDLLMALKSEEDMARIPLILLTPDIPEEQVHFHLGTTSQESTAALEYLSDQVARLLRGDEPAVAEENPESDPSEPQSLAA
ncbi:MAG TPA: ATP-binding protein [Capsulimonadaceae bacterium]|nr:ATP-binding protein [Capsulimonadaceae bacterium]